MKDSLDTSRIFWLSGTPCTGKTTVSTVLSKELNWNVYHIDDYFSDHRERSNAEEHGMFHTISHLRDDALWLRPIEEQIVDEKPFCDGEVPLILEDLSYELQRDSRPLLFEGYISPEILETLVETRNHAFYLVPTDAFQRHHYEKREFIHEVLARTSDPQLAWENWMARDSACARRLESELKQSSFAWLSVDGSRSIESTINHVKNHFLQTLH